MPHLQGSLLADSKHVVPVPVPVAELEEDKMEECAACGSHLERVLICPRCRMVEEWLRDHDQPKRNNVLRSTSVRVQRVKVLVGLGTLYCFAWAAMRLVFLALKKVRK
jgi:hypothetical protein